MFKWFGFVTEIYLLFIKYSSKVINGCIRFHKPFSFFYVSSNAHVYKRRLCILSKQK